MNYFSSKNESEMRRWVMITTMNKRINSPIRKCPFPKFTPLDIIPNATTLHCDESIDNTVIDEEFLRDSQQDNSASSFES